MNRKKDAQRVKILREKISGFHGGMAVKRVIDSLQDAYYETIQEFEKANPEATEAEKWLFHLYVCRCIRECADGYSA
jgi:hypothetical protein